MPQEEIKSTNEKQEEIKTPEATAEAPLTMEQLQAQILALQAKLEEMKKTSQDTEQAETARIDKAVEKLGVGNPVETAAVKTEVKEIEVEKQTVLATAETKLGEEAKTAEAPTERIKDKIETDKKINIKESAKESLNDSSLKRFYDGDTNKIPIEIQDSYKDLYKSKLISLKHKIASGDLSLEDAKYEAEEAAREVTIPWIKDKKIRENNFDLPGATDENKASFYQFMNRPEQEINKELLSLRMNPNRGTSENDLKFFKRVLHELEETEKNAISGSRNQLDAGSTDFKKSNAAIAELDRQINVINKLISSESTKVQNIEPKVDHPNETEAVKTETKSSEESESKFTPEQIAELEEFKEFHEAKGAETTESTVVESKEFAEKKAAEEETDKPQKQSAYFTAEELTKEFEMPEDTQKTEKIPENQPKIAHEDEEQIKQIDNLIKTQKDYFNNLTKGLTSYSLEFPEEAFGDLYKKVGEMRDNKTSDQTAINNIVSKIELFIEKTKNAKNEYYKIIDALDKKDNELKKDASSDAFSWRSEIDKKSWEISKKAPNFDQKLYFLEQILNEFKK